MNTRTKTSLPAAILCNRMLFNFKRSTHFIKVSNLFPLFSINHQFFKKVSNLFPLFSINHQFSSTPLQSQSNKPHTDTPSINISGITKSILNKSSNLLGKTTHHSTANVTSVQELLLSVSHINPRIIRKFWRKNELKLQDFTELVVGFESNVGKLGIDAKKVGSLFGFCKWVCSNNKKGIVFKHFDQSFKIMVGLLVRVGLYKDAEWVLLLMEKEGILLDDCEVFSNLIEWYVGVFELEKGIYMYDRMRALNLVSSSSCYRTLVNYLICKRQSECLFRVYGDMVDGGLGEKDIYENVIRALCRAGKVLESRILVKKADANGIKPNYVILDAISSGYCEKKDYFDLLSLFSDINCVPDVAIGNKIIHSMCQNLDVDKSLKYLEDLQDLGFNPDAITYGILIGWSCKEGNLKKALIFLSNFLSKGLKPHKYSYNAIISGVFKEGMWNHAKEIVLEMEDEGVTLDISTFRVLVAGYCKSRKFDEVKVIIEMMVNKGLIKLLPLEDHITKAFSLLGIDPLAVKVRRDNDVALSRTEFYDSVGNGLYLEGDVIEFDRTMINVLNDSMIPDYNCLIVNDEGFSNYKAVDELVQWGQELSFAAFSTLVNKFRASNSGFKTITTLLENMPKLYENLDQETLNFLIRAHIKRGFLHKAKKLYDEMVKENAKIENETYSALVTGLCKKGNSKDLLECWDLVQYKKWLPTLKDYKTLIYSLCENNMLSQSLFLFERAFMDYPQDSADYLYDFLEKLCKLGFSKVALVLFEKLLETGYELDYVAYNHILYGLMKENRFSEAFAISDRMLTKRLLLTFDVYNALLYGYCLVNDMKKVNELFGTILKKNVTIYVSSYSKLVSLMCKTGRFNLALWLKDLMVKQSFVHITVYNILIFHFMASRNIELVDALLDEIQESGLEFDSFTYNFLVYGFSKCKLSSRSNYYLIEMMYKDLKPSNRSIRAVIRSLSEYGEFVKVLNFSQEMEKKNWVHCSFVQNKVVEGLLNIGKVQEAVNFLDNMIVKDLIPDNINYDNLIKLTCHYGKKDKAYDLLDTMLKKENVPDSTSYDCLIQHSCVSNSIEEALDLYTEMMNLKLVPSTKTYEVLIEKLCECGRTLEAEKLIDAMICIGEKPSKVMFGSVVSRYKFERNFKRASGILQRMQQFGYKPDFETHWSLISTLSRFSDRDKVDDNRSFLSRLLSESGFNPKKGVDSKSNFLSLHMQGLFVV
ncbi:pentatricopeptide repeat-containing protein At5g15280, mitochondrial [Rutidosis leptorrhynchoides]|uniref:pentatricopeptide repeat-containing protein At5g15280, mitochondrial n=1 Tax=Rutidosis leptorrhynchoides TaxID=125765 RepID=UPI003A9A6274